MDKSVVSTPISLPFVFALDTLRMRLEYISYSLDTTRERNKHDSFRLSLQGAARKKGDSLSTISLIGFVSDGSGRDDFPLTHALERGLYLSDDSLLRLLDEADDFAYLGAIGHLFLDLHDGIEDAGLTVKHQSVGVGDVLEHLVADAIGAAHGGVDAAEGDGRSTGNDVGRDVLGEGCSGLNHGSFADACGGIFDDATGVDDAVGDVTVAGNLRSIAEDALVAHHRIVRDVGAFHEEIVVADDGLPTGVGGAVDDDVLANDVIVADDELGLLTTEVEVLRQGSDDGSLVHLVVAAHAGAVEDAHEGEDDAVVADDDIVFNIDEGEYLTVVADLGSLSNLGFGRNIA